MLCSSCLHDGHSERCNNRSFVRWFWLQTCDCTYDEIRADKLRQKYNENYLEKLKVKDSLLGTPILTNRKKTNGDSPYHGIMDPLNPLHNELVRGQSPFMPETWNNNSASLIPVVEQTDNRSGCNDDTNTGNVDTSSNDGYSQCEPSAPSSDSTPSTSYD